jgi:hypothetical protein
VPRRKQSRPRASWRKLSGVRSSELFGSVRTYDQLARVLNDLIDSWCQNRQLDALRLLLPVWPLQSGPLTDDWGQLVVALRAIENSGTLQPDERDSVHSAAEYVTRLLHSRIDNPQ